MHGYFDVLQCHIYSTQYRPSKNPDHRLLVYIQAHVLCFGIKKHRSFKGIYMSNGVHI